MALAGYTYRRKITIDHTKIDATLTDFPVLSKICNTTLDWAKILSTGYDIRFTSSNGNTLLKFERVIHSWVDNTNDVTLERLTIGDEQNLGAAFDNDLVDATNSGAWYCYSGGGYQTTGYTGQDFQHKNFTCTQYKIYPINHDTRTYDAKNWTFEGWNGSAWITLDTQTNQSFTKSVWKTYDIVNTTAYSKYRVNVSANNGHATYLIVQEIEMSGITALAEYHVKIPSISSSVDTEIYMYYGKAGDSDGQDAVNVWDASFLGVYHLKDDPDSSTVQDSTSNNRDGTKGSAGHPTEVDGLNYKSQLYDGNEYINVGDIDYTNQNITIESLCSPDVVNDEDAIFGTINAGGNTGESQLTLYIKSSVLQAYLGQDLLNSQEAVSVLNPSTEIYQYIAVKAEGSGNNLTFFLNSTSDTVAQTTDIDCNNEDNYIGAIPYYNQPFVGFIGEIRVSDTNRSNAWMKATSYSILNDLITWGAEEEVSEEASGVLFFGANF